jgi:cobalt/nickel transport system permease protein
LRILRRAHVPAVMVTILALMYRYIFVLIDEMERLNRARQSRTFANRKRFTWYSLSLIIGQLFVRSAQRAERVFGAMSARGWK